MKYIKNFAINEASNNNKPKSNTSLVTDLCVSMLLINPDFLNNILDHGKYTRYTENNSVFMNDLKSMLLAKNRLKLGILKAGKYIEEDNIGKINSYFNEYSKDFDIKKDFNKLSKARDIARNISDKILMDEKMTENMIRSVYWIAPNKGSSEKEDIVIELNNGIQYPIVLNSRIATSKTKSFNTILDTLIGQRGDRLFHDNYLNRWDKLTKEWFKLIYDNTSTKYKLMIEQFIDPSRADSLTFFDFQQIEIKDPEFKILGKHFPELGKNYKDLTTLLSDIWKNRKGSIIKYEEVQKQWVSIKTEILNSGIIEDILITNFRDMMGDSKEMNGEFVISSGTLKSRMLKLIVDIIGVENQKVYFVSKNDIYHIPPKQWFRDNYSDIQIEYDYHQKLTKESDYQFKMKISIGDDLLLSMTLATGFIGNEMSGKLNSKIFIDFDTDFNRKITKK